MLQCLSIVPGHSGFCTPVWLNTNQIDTRISGGTTGFFRLTKPFWLFPLMLVKTGPEFHGIIRCTTPEGTPLVDETTETRQPAA